MRVKIELDMSPVAELDHADTHPVLAYVQFADNALSEVLHSLPVAFVVLVDTPRRVDDEDDISLGVTRSLA